MTRVLKEMYREYDISVYDPADNGSKESYMYDAKCYDGYAIANIQVPVPGIPNVLRMVYPSLAEVMSDKEMREDLYDYRRGFSSKKNVKHINYADIAVMFGAIAERNYN